MTSLKPDWGNDVDKKDLIKLLAYRPEDANVIREVIEGGAYRRVRLKFDVEPGENWLDLGANVGAFTAYAAYRGASRVTSFEPEPSCFEYLSRNAAVLAAEFQVAIEVHRSAVSAERSAALNFRVSRRPTVVDGVKYGRTQSRGTTMGVFGYEEVDPVPNRYAGDLPGPFDGVKMDIEGSEMGILDQKLLPRAEKLVLEYHSSRDQDFEAAGRRFEYLKELYRNVQYNKGIQKFLRGEGKPFFDETVFCWGLR